MKNYRCGQPRWQQKIKQKAHLVNSLLISFEKNPISHSGTFDNLRLQHLLRQHTNHLRMMPPNFKQIPQNTNLSLFGFRQNFKNVMKFTDGGKGMGKTFRSQIQKSLYENVNFQRRKSTISSIVIHRWIGQFFQNR